jgi:hypothetical protein
MMAYLRRLFLHDDRRATLDDAIEEHSKALRESEETTQKVSSFSKGIARDTAATLAIVDNALKARRMNK